MVAIEVTEETVLALIGQFRQAGGRGTVRLFIPLIPEHIRLHPARHAIQSRRLSN